LLHKDPIRIRSTCPCLRRQVRRQGSDLHLPFCYNNSMSWIFFAFLTSFANSFLNIANKSLTKLIDEYKALFLISLSTSVILVIILFLGLFYKFIDLSETIKSGFWLPLTLTSFLGVLAFIFLYRALQQSDVSKVIPFISFTPIFILFIEYLIYGKLPKLQGLIGVFIIVIGTLIFEVRKTDETSLKPFLRIFKNKSSLYVILTALIWSVTSVLDKVATLNSSPIIYSTLSNIYKLLIILPIFVIRSKKHPLILKGKDSARNAPTSLLLLILITAILHIAEIIFQTTAISTGFVSYVLAIKRTSIVFTVFLAYAILKEKPNPKLLFSTIVMLAGVILIVL